MKIFDEIRGEASIAVLAEKKGVPKAEIEAAIQSVIDETWSAIDPESSATRRKIFRGVKPSPALFVGRLARYAER